jgi:trimeric autotransporter adhesin
MGMFPLNKFDTVEREHLCDRPLTGRELEILEMVSMGNTFVGAFSGNFNTTGQNNVYLGYKAGENAGDGNGNVFIGFESGLNESGSNRLYIENSSSSTPLIYGEFDNDKIVINGSVHISGFAQLTPGAAPLSPIKGTIYYDASDDKVKVWTGTLWENLN